jgi:hypothetical protein
MVSCGLIIISSREHLQLGTAVSRSEVKKKGNGCKAFPLSKGRQLPQEVQLLSQGVG